MSEFESVINALQPLLGELTDGAIWIAAMYIGFRLLISLTVPLCVIWVVYKFGLMIKDYACKKKVTIIENNITLDRDIITHDEVCLENIKEAFRICRENAGLLDSNYMHKCHSEFLLNTVKEKAKINDS